MIELTLAEDIPEIAKSGDTIVLKDDGQFEMRKADGAVIVQKPFAGYKDFNSCVAQNKDKGDPDAYCGSIKHKIESEVNKEYDPRIEKYLSIDKEKSWSLLTKFYNAGHLDSYKVLKDFINKIATCPDVTEKFEKIMDGWMRDGEADTSSIEKIIDSCKKEGGNVVREGDDKKIKSIEKTAEIIEIVKKENNETIKLIDEIIKESDVANPRLRTTYQESEEQEAARLKRKPTEKETDKHYFAQK